MKVYIQTDIEGVAGFCFFENRKNKDYENVLHRQRMYKLFTAEVNAAVTAAFEAGATEVYVNDSHGTGIILFLKNLTAAAKLFTAIIVQVRIGCPNLIQVLTHWFLSDFTQWAVQNVP